MFAIYIYIVSNCTTIMFQAIFVFHGFSIKYIDTFTLLVGNIQIITIQK